MKWLRCALTVPEEQLDVARAALLLEGFAGWEEEESPEGSLLVCYCGIAQEEAVDEARATLGRVVAAVPGCAQATSWVDDEDWAHAWKAFWKPQRIGNRIWVVPSWESVEASAEDLVITLDPGMAFGTGTHETTRMCLQWLERLIGPADQVIDVGTGSGILAVAALKLGAVSVLAADNDPIAVRTAAENLELNGVAQRATVREAAGLDCVGAGERPVDVITANLVADLIVGLAPGLAKHLKEAGVFVGSGIIRERVPDVERALREAGYGYQMWERLGEWASVAASRVSSSRLALL